MQIIWGIFVGLVIAFFIWLFLSGPVEGCGEETLPEILEDLSNNIARLESFAARQEADCNSLATAIEDAQLANIKVDREYHVALPLAEKLRHNLSMTFAPGGGAR